MWPLSDEIARDYRQKMAQQAQMAHLLKQRGPRNRTLPGHLLVITGNTLISLGLWFKHISRTSNEEIIAPLYT